MEGGEIIAVSDAAGFVGAFLTVVEAKAKVLDRFKLIPFLVQRFQLEPTDEKAPLNIWVVPYRDTNAVAFVSNSRSKAVQVQKSLQNVGLTYPDTIDYWMLPLGKVVVAAGERLASITRAHQIYADESLREEEKQREAAADELIQRVIEDRLDGPLDRLIRENERITLFDCVVDIVDFDQADCKEAGVQVASLDTGDASSADVSTASVSTASVSNADVSNADVSNADASNADVSSVEASSVEASSVEVSSVEVSNAKEEDKTGVDIAAAH